MLGLRWYYQVRLRLRTLFRREQVEKELEEEFRFHLDQRYDEELARGLPAEEARAAALRAMDGIERNKEECRDMRRTNFIDDLFRDARYAARSLRRTPLVTAVAVFSLALGIGANTAIFTILDALLLRTLPVKDARQVVVLSWVAPENVSMRLMRNITSLRSSDANTDSSPSFSFPVFESMAATR
jgi:hypothetical protein